MVSERRIFLCRSKRPTNLGKNIVSGIPKLPNKEKEEQNSDRYFASDIISQSGIISVEDAVNGNADQWQHVQERILELTEKVQNSLVDGDKSKLLGTAQTDPQARKT